MIEKFENYGDYELGKIAHDFMNCGNYESCRKCSCDGIICNVGESHDYIKAREAFTREFTKRMME